METMLVKGTLQARVWILIAQDRTTKEVGKVWCFNREAEALRAAESYLGTDKAAVVRPSETLLVINFEQFEQTPR